MLVVVADCTMDGSMPVSVYETIPIQKRQGSLISVALCLIIYPFFKKLLNDSVARHIQPLSVATDNKVSCIVLIIV